MTKLIFCFKFAVLLILQRNTRLWYNHMHVLSRSVWLWHSRVTADWVGDRLNSRQV